MNNIDDILAKLRAGVTEEDIAQEMTKALNAAVQQKKEEDAKLAARTKEKRTASLCDRTARDLCNIFTDFLIGLGEEDLAKKCGSANAIECIKEVLETVADMTKTNILSNYLNLLKSIDDLRVSDKPNYKNIVIGTNDFDKGEEDVDSIFEKWLKEHGL